MRYALGICPLCDRFSLLIHEICPDCLYRLYDIADEVRTFAFCPECRTRLFHQDSVCLHDGPVHAVISIFPHTQASDALIRQFMDEGCIRLSETVAHLISKAIISLQEETKHPAIVPVPCEESRRRKLGWDPLVLVGKRISHDLGIPFLELLDRRAPTISSKDKLDRTLYNTTTLVVLDGRFFQNGSTVDHMDILSQVYGLPTIAVCWSKD